MVYINLDNCASGSIFYPDASPTVGHKAIEATKVLTTFINLLRRVLLYNNYMQMVAAPYDSDDGRSYYDYMVDYFASDPQSSQTEPTVGVVGSGSDHSNFIFIQGVPVVDLSFELDVIKYPGLRGKSYPAYHTGYLL